MIKIISGITKIRNILFIALQYVRTISLVSKILLFYSTKRRLNCFAYRKILSIDCRCKICTIDIRTKIVQEIEIYIYIYTRSREYNFGISQDKCKCRCMKYKPVYS